MLSLFERDMVGTDENAAGDIEVFSVRSNGNVREFKRAFIQKKIISKTVEVSTSSMTATRCLEGSTSERASTSIGGVGRVDVVWQ